MVQLNYKASNIAKAEKEQGENFLEKISTLNGIPPVSDLMFLFTAGGGTIEEFDEFMKEEGVGAVTVEVVASIAESGFLGKSIDAKQLRRDMEEELQNKRMMAEAFKKSVESIAASANSGETKKN
ncbi:hypothetical protein JEO88_03065 [Candidatus Saccharibacteria bacterium]|jgi:hypothetical protein|nr:hypothetical protein [Candidatus Saccharibacteria bacterium]